MSTKAAIWQLNLLITENEYVNIIYQYGFTYGKVKLFLLLLK